MVVDAKAVFISSVRFTCSLPALRVTLSVGTGAFFSCLVAFLVAAATRRECLCVFLLTITSSLDGACML